MEYRPRFNTRYLRYLFFCIILAILLCLFPVSGSQKNHDTISIEQAYLDAESRIFKPLRTICKWLDDANYLLAEDDDQTNSQKLLKVKSLKGTKTLFLNIVEIPKNLPFELVRPLEIPEGYKMETEMPRTSTLKGMLFLAHGNLDDNGHVQNTIQITERLMDRGKTSFGFMLRPDQRHGFKGKKRELLNRKSTDFWFKHLLSCR